MFYKCQFFFIADCKKVVILSSWFSTLLSFSNWFTSLVSRLWIFSSKWGIPGFLKKNRPFKKTWWKFKKVWTVVRQNAVRLTNIVSLSVIEVWEDTEGRTAMCRWVMQGKDRTRVTLGYVCLPLRYLPSRCWPPTCLAAAGLLPA